MTLEVICKKCGAVLYTDSESKKEMLKKHKCRKKGKK